MSRTFYPIEVALQDILRKSLVLKEFISIPRKFFTRNPLILWQQSYFILIYYVYLSIYFYV